MNISQEKLQFLVERQFSTRQIAVTGVSQRTVERRLCEFNLSIRASYSTLNDEELGTVIKGILPPGLKVANYL